jgi:divalent metal cation (Fe/Co/Zn/Cd) transporter
LKTDARNSIKDASASFIAFGSVLVASLGFYQADAAGGMLISFYILIVAYVALRESSLVLLDAFHEPEMTREIESLIKSNKYVIGIRDLRLRMAGPFIVGTLEIIVDGSMTVNQVHSISTELENSVKNRIAGLRTLVVRAVPQAGSSGTVS